MISHTNVRRARALAVAAVALTLASTLTACQKVTGGRYVNRVFTEVEHVAVNEVYRTALDFDLKADVSLRLDIWQPRGDTIEKRPAVVWMHGGGWTKNYGDRTMMYGYAQDSALRGYVGVSIDYRLQTSAVVPGAWLDAYDDSVAAVQWLTDNAARFRIDPKAIIAGGYSAGAINAVNLVYPPYERSQPSPPASPVIGAIGIAGHNSGLAIPQRPPVLMFSAVDDGTVRNADTVSRCDENRAWGNVCELVTYPSGGHGIAFGQIADIQNRSAQFAMDKMLPTAGYYLG
jgi:acetyl esterase/lipase